MKKFLCTLLIMLTSLSCACTPANTAETENTDIKTEIQTDTKPVTSVAPEAVPVTASIDFSSLNITPAVIRPEENGAFTYVYENGNMTVTTAAPGEGRIVVLNDYSEQASVAVTVDEYLRPTFSYEPYKAPEKSANVTDFGAKADGVTNDTASIQAAIDSVEGGGTVYIPAGTYIVTYMEFRQGVTIRLFGCLPDATVGYNGQTEDYVSSGKLAILKSDTKISHMFYNLPRQSYCTNGVSDFALFGGLLDCRTKGMAFVWACGNNITLGNCIIKDISNNHAIQIDGCHNVTIDNVMFAGYTYKGTNTRETIQIEATTPGALSSNLETTPVKCDPGDLRHNSDISITNCYFGKSDVSGPHLTPIGHHGYHGETPTCNRLLISGCVFDNPLYCGLHLLNFENVTVTDNKFISDSDLCESAIEQDSALISLYSKDSDITYQTGGKTVTYAKNYENSGIHNFIIKNNTFTLGSGTFLRVLYLNGTGNLPGARYVSGIIRPNGVYNKTIRYSGFANSVNYFSDINFTENLIEYSSAPAYTNYCIFASGVRRFNSTGNTLNISEGMNLEYENGANLKNVQSGSEADTLYFYTNSNAKKDIYIGTDESFTAVKCTSSSDKRFAVVPGEGGSVKYEIKDGSVYITPVPDEGYVFNLWLSEEGASIDLSAGYGSNISVTASFKKQ